MERRVANVTTRPLPHQHNGGRQTFTERSEQPHIPAIHQQHSDAAYVFFLLIIPQYANETEVEL